MAEEQVKKPVLDEVATAAKDIDIFAGWLKRLENPDPVLRTESAGKGIKLYDEVTRDPHAASVLQTRYLAVTGKEWEVIPAEGPPSRGRRASVTQAEKIAEFVKQSLLDCNFDQGRQEMLQGILYGFYPGEVMWEVRDGRVVPARIRAKHPRRFSFTVDRELRLLTPQNMIEGEPVPDRKFVVFTYGSSDNPYGSGLGQKLWWPVWFKKNGIKFWLVFLEKFGSPTPVGKYPPGTSDGDKQKLIEAIDAMQQETGIAIPDTMALDLLEAARTGQASYETLCDYMDRQISKAVLGQTLTTEIKGEGSYAASETHDEVRQEVVKADADLLCECLNGTLVKWIVDYNFPGVTAYPKLWIRTEPEEDLKSLAERDKTLVKEIGLPVSKKYFYETYAIPEPEEGEEVVTPSGAGPGRGPGGAPKPGSATFSAGTERDRQVFREKTSLSLFGQEDVDGIAAAGAEAAGKEMEKLLAPLLETVQGAKSLGEIGERIYELYPKLRSDEFQELLGRSMFAAGLTGYAAAKGDE